MRKLAKVSEKEITSAIVSDFCKEFLESVSTDVAIIGAGPSGLLAARDLSRQGFKTTLIESNNYLGGGFWIGGYLMNGVTVREPANEILDELNVPYKKMSDGLYLASGPHACSKLIASCCESGVKIINMTKFDDVVLGHNNRVRGVVINWTPVSALPRAITCVDPVAIEAKIVIDATGHDARVANILAQRNLLKLKGFGAMWVNESEDALIEKTGEVYPGLIVCGMAAATVFGIPRMGPTFAGMLFSGQKAAIEARKLLLTLDAKVACAA